MVALALGAKAFSMTLGDAGASSLDAIGLGARWLRDGRARACVVVGAFSVNPEVTGLITRCGLLAPNGDVRPFDHNASGAGLGEAAVAFVLERGADAEARGTRALGYVRGHGAAFAHDAAGFEAALLRASRHALREAEISPSDVALVSAGAAGAPAFDRAEASALRSLFGERAASVPVIAVNGAFGDTLDASGAVQALSALSCFRQAKAPGIAHLDVPAIAGLRYLTKAEAVAPGNAMVTSLAQDGSCSALVISGTPRLPR
jgi:3-oxoacyl-(acyl-carrier-protein) synthase